MSDSRSVVMTGEQAALVDEMTQRLMREGDLRAMQLGALFMAYKFARPLEPPLPENVVAIDNWSRKAPCA